jgi:hypothetical protein
MVKWVAASAAYGSNAPLTKEDGTPLTGGFLQIHFL